METRRPTPTVFILYLIFELYCYAETGVPVFTLDGQSGWRLQDGAITFEVTPAGGVAASPDTSCSIDYGDGEKENGVAWKENFTLTHTFSYTGTFNTTMVCSNYNSSFTAFHIVKIVPGDIPIQQLVASIPSYILVDSIDEIRISISEGTDVLYKVTVGGGSPIWVHTNGYVKTKSLRYKFVDVGPVTTIVTANNDVSLKQTRTKCDVLHPVKGFVLKASHSIASVKNVVVFSVWSPGSQNFPMGPLLIELFNNLTSITTKNLLEAEANNIIKVHETNLSRGEHEIIAKISSPVHHEEVSVMVTVIDTIHAFNLSDVSFHADSVIPMTTSQSSVNVTIHISIDGVDESKPPPLGVCTSWLFDDSSGFQTEHLTSWSRTHLYNRRGNYDIRISVKLTGDDDLISTVTLPVRVGVILAGIQPLMGNAGETKFTLNITGVFGSDVKYLVDFGAGGTVVFNKTDVSQNNVTTVEKVLDAAGWYHTRIVVESELFVEEIVLDEQLSVFWPIKSYAVAWKQQTKEPPVLVSVSLNFKEPFPTNLTCSVNFGEVYSSIEVKFESMSENGAQTTSLTTEQTTFWTPVSTKNPVENTTTERATTVTALGPTRNQTANQSLYENQTMTYSEGYQSTTVTKTPTAGSTPMILKHKEINVEYKYSKIGKFSLAVSCYNAVSNVSESHQIALQASAVTGIPLIFLEFSLGVITLAVANLW